MKPPDNKLLQLGTLPSESASKTSASSGTKARSRDRSLDFDEIELVETPQDYDFLDQIEMSTEAKPNPIELPAPINPDGTFETSVEAHRNLFCVHYDECLDNAVRRSWNSFTCVRCTFYRLHHQDEEADISRFATQRRGQ